MRMKNITILLLSISAITGCSIDPAYQAKKEKQITIISQFVEAAKLGEQIEYHNYFTNEITPYRLCNNLDRFGYKINCYKLYKEISPKLKNDNETYTLVMDKLYYIINNSEDAMRYRKNKSYEYAQTISKDQYIQIMKELYDIMNGIDNADKKFNSTILKNSLPLAIEVSKLSRQGMLATYGYTDMNKLSPQINRTKALDESVRNANIIAEKRMKDDIEKRCNALKIWMKKYDHYGFEYINIFGKEHYSDTKAINIQDISNKIIKVNRQYCSNNN